MKERLLQLRKTLKLSQSDFGSKLGVTSAAISRYENGERNLTEQMLLSICREFRVNYFWLTEGKGDMFTGTPESVIDEIAEDYNLDEIDKRLLEKYLNLTAEQRKVIKDYMKDVFT